MRRLRNHSKAWIEGRALFVQAGIGINMSRWLLLICMIVISSVPASATPRWMTLPPTPMLPAPAASGFAPVNGVRIWYATFGAGEPVVLLHGGLANSNYWGGQVPELAKHYRVIVMDSRGHGRSTRDAQPYGYDLMASDVLGLMDYLHIREAAIVGWSDGGIIGLDIAIHHPERLTKVFAFGANSDPSAVMDVNANPVFSGYIRRAGKEYAALSPTPHDYKSFLAQISRMWAVEPHFTAANLATIRVPVLIADADHEESIKRENILFMAEHTPSGCLLIEPGVSHFAALQDPGQFTHDVEHFLQHPCGQ